MDDITRRDPIKITAEDINPRYNWGRHLPVLGTMGVDFEERVDYRRMHRYRLARAQAALEASDLGALLLFDDNNIRYVTSTKIGEWARDKLSRCALLMRGGDPDPVGLRLGRRASQALFALAQAGELQGRSGRPARHGRSGLRPDEAPRRGNGLDPARRRRRQNADRRRHHRAADDVRTGKGRAEDQGRPAGDAERARGEIRRRDRAAQPRRRDGRRRL